MLRLPIVLEPFERPFQRSGRVSFCVNFDIPPLVLRVGGEPAQAHAAGKRGASGGKGQLEDFISTGYERFMIDPALKKNIVFTAHDLVTDQVFGEMQLVICRNVLIYFRRELQARVLTLFYQSLDLGGFMGLGIKESLSAFPGPGQFRTVDAHVRLFQRIN